MWHMRDFVPPEFLDTALFPSRKRQEFFNAACLGYCSSMNRSWVASIDTDEYVVFNRFTSSDPDWEMAKEIRWRQQQASDSATLSPGEQLILTRSLLPPTGGPTTIHDFIKQEHLMSHQPWVYQSCVPMTRLMFGARETPSVMSRDNETIVPIGFQAEKFDTLRFLQHRAKGICHANCKGKVLVDVSRIPKEHLVHEYYVTNKSIPTSTFGAHDPVRECNGTLIPSYRHSVLRVHHYLGSHEAFFARHDPRRTNKKFGWYKNLQSEPELEARGWLKSFVDSVGLDKAHRLLKGVGVIEIRDGAWLNISTNPSP